MRNVKILWIKQGKRFGVKYVLPPISQDIMRDNIGFVAVIRCAE